MAWLYGKYPCNNIQFVLHIVATYISLGIARSLISDRATNKVDFIMFENKTLEKEQDRQWHWKKIREYRKYNYNVIAHFIVIFILTATLGIEYLLLQYYC